MKRGEIRWYTFPKPDKRRPVVILTRSSVLEYLNEVTVAPVTRTVRHIPSEVALSPEDGMPFVCAVNCDHIQTVSKTRIGPLIAVLCPEKNRELASAVAFALGLQSVMGG